jgi:hypothetical protein
VKSLEEILEKLGLRPSLAERYERIATKIDAYDLQRSGSSSRDLTLTEEDLLGDLTGEHYHSTRIVDFYTEAGFEFALERYGLLDQIRELDFRDLRFTFDLDDPKRQHIACFGTKGDEEHLLVDLMMGRIRISAPPGLEPAQPPLELLSIEWMMLQNPTETFAPDHPRWPGQEHPGLGLNHEIMLLHIQSARRLGLDGVVNHPSRYHVAFFGRDRIYFLDPEIQGRFDALREALGDLDLTDATWRMERGEVRWADDDSPVEWHPRDYVLPLSQRLVEYFESTTYQEPRTEAYLASVDRGIRLVDS